jgi:predicted transglutaminase-like cysteine proteinase
MNQESLDRKLLDKINRAVNWEIAYERDIDQYGVSERWAIPENDKGDCEDYALEKRRRLLAAGWPESDLRMATCLTEKGGGHGVLIAVLDGTWWVMDNRYDTLFSWGQMQHYQWQKMQDDAGVWREVVA